jgi:hypothetical protein
LAPCLKRRASDRFKEAIPSMEKQSRVILKLYPVSFRYKEELDPAKTAQFGLIAEEVAKVNPDLVTRDEKGGTYSVRYEAVNAMLLNEFLKEHAKIEELEKTVARLESAVKKETAQIQKTNSPSPVRNSASRRGADTR